MAHKDLVPLNKRTKEEQRRITRMGGIASGKSRRDKKSLSDRIKLALKISTNENLKVIKKQIREVLPNRNKANNKEVLKTLLAQARVMKDCGVDVYNILKIAESPETQEMALKATNALWDREEGKAIQSIVSNNSTEVKNTVLVTKEEIADEVSNMEEILDE